MLDPPQALGVLGQESWFVTKFTALEDPTLTTYLGMQGEDNRRKLAETFLRPTTWQEYCEQVSLDQCGTDDGVAHRAPKDETEYDRMFVEGLYTGHFRATDSNDCDKNPINCTGHIADFPCGWSSIVESQAYHLNMALESSGKEPGSKGYSHSQLKEMWYAANATKSNLLMYYWTPDPLYDTFVGTDAELQKVVLPPPTAECFEYRSAVVDRCSENKEDRIGDPRGVCDDPPSQLNKLITRSTYDSIYDPSIPEAIRSPAYDVFRLFRLNQLQLSEIFDAWLDNRDNPREAVCEWVNSHMDVVEQFIPVSYPRVLKDSKEEVKILGWSAVAAGCFATLLVVWTSGMVLRYRKKKSLVYAQIEFLGLLLAGSFGTYYWPLRFWSTALDLLIRTKIRVMIIVSPVISGIATGAIVTALPPTDVSCGISAWLINAGYTLELVPLIVKTAAVNKLVSAAHRLRRVQLTRTSLFGAVAMISALVLAFLTAWTILDAPGREAEYELTENVIPNAMFGNLVPEIGTCGNGTRGNGFCDDGTCCSGWGWCGDTEEHCREDARRYEITGDTVVNVRHYCDSESQAWQFAAVGWNTLLLLCASVLAYQSRTTRSEFNESQTLAFMIYSHLIFVILRLSTFALSGSLKESILENIRSLIFSADTITTIVIYFVPKFLADEQQESSWMQAISAHSRIRGQENSGSLDGFAATPRKWIISSISFLSRHENPHNDAGEETNHAVATSSQGTHKCPECGTMLDPSTFLDTSAATTAHETMCKSDDHFTLDGQKNWRESDASSTEHP